MSSKVVGVIGGMGPEAALDFCMRVLRLTPAACDQEHIHVILDNNTSIPDRIRAIVDGGESPLDEIVSSARKLEQAGAQILAMPCNGAHAWFAELAESIQAKLLNMIEAAVSELRGVEKAGLLATDATVRSGVYERAARKRGVELVVPGPAEQAEVVQLIRDVKSGRRETRMHDALSKLCGGLASRGAEAVILGCTELPLIAREVNGVDLVDSTESLARLTVEEAFA